MQFVELDGEYKGRIYDGTNTNGVGYVHWIPGLQSTYLYYSHKICFICEYNSVSIKMKNNEVFSLVNPKPMSYKLNEILIPVSNGYQSASLSPHIVSSSQYMYIIYFVAQSKEPGEYLEDIEIFSNGAKISNVRIGGDFYAENEQLYINLANFGVEIPEAIQKTFYESSLAEPYRDNILLNRKWKELLSNYWDVIANKGSYKSLINSLKWFEWGDKLRLQELWKHKSPDGDRYDMRELSSLMQEKYKDCFENTRKTTYLSLTCALKDINISKRDNNINISITDNSFKWSREELALKVSLLGNFFETYFTPIHIDLIHAAVEIPIASSNSYYMVSGGTSKVFNGKQIYSFNCNVKDGSKFYLQKVDCQVGPNTIFKNDTHITGVDTPTYSGQVGDNSKLQTFFSQLYSEKGYILTINCLNCGNKHILLTPNSNLKIYKDGEYLSESSLNSNKYLDELKFNILLKEVGEYKLIMNFVANGKIYYKELTVHVLPFENYTLKLYKVENSGSKKFEFKHNFKSAGDGTISGGSELQYVYNLGEYVSEFTPGEIHDGEYLYVEPSQPFNEERDSQIVSWEFRNKNGKSTKLTGSRMAAIVAPTSPGYLPNGYYDIIMKYKINGKRKEAVFKNAFRKV